MVMSRTDDSYLENEDRVNHAAASGTDFFVSLHANTYGGGAVSGTEVYYHRSDFGDDSIALAESLLESISAGSGFDKRGVEQRSLEVLKQAAMPAALIEIGFMTNEDDFERLMTEEEDIAESIANGIERYVRE